MRKKHLLAILLAFFATIQIAFAAIDINTASEAELDKLPGIGPVKAKAIVSDRQKNGAFKTPEDLKRVKGIGDKTFATLKDQITVNGATDSTTAAPAKDADTSKKGGKKSKKADKDAASSATK